MKSVGFENISHFDSVTVMNDTCFGPLWDIKDYYSKFELDDSVDFWGLTNNRETKNQKKSRLSRTYSKLFYLI